MTTEIDKIYENFPELERIPVFRMNDNLFEIVYENHRSKKSHYEPWEMLSQVNMWKLPFKECILEAQMDGNDETGNYTENITTFHIVEKQPETFVISMYSTFFSQRDLKLKGFKFGNMFQFDKEFGKIEASVIDCVPNMPIVGLPTNDGERIDSYFFMCCNALTIMTVLLNTKGVQSEQIAAPKFLNKKRLQKGKPAIPSVTLIKIGRVFNRDGSSNEFDERKPVRVHWRRGHLRRVATGAGRVNREYRWIEACLVNYVDGPEPTYTAKVTT